MLPKKIRRAQASHVFFRAVDDKAVPIVLHEQEAAIGLGKILHAEFDKGAMGDVQMIDEELDDPVLAPLRKHLELVLPERPGGIGPLHLGQHPALINLDLVDTAVQLQ